MLNDSYLNIFDAQIIIITLTNEQKIIKLDPNNKKN